MPKRPKRRYQSIVRAVHEAIWAIRPEKLETICGFLARRSAGDVLTREEVQAAIAGKPVPRIAASGKVALIPVMGTIAQRMSLMADISGGSSTEQIGQALDAAVANPEVSTIVLDVDSPGGTIWGVEALAEKIYAARSKKRIIAVANSEAASAAYWLASAASEVVVAPGGWVGSIGVMQLHQANAERQAKLGFETTITRRPATKAEGAFGEKLSDEAKAYRQHQVDQTYATFVGAVAKYRKTSTARVEAGFGSGRMMLAADALAAGMVDRVATLEQVLGDLGVTAKTQSDHAGEPAYSLENVAMNAKIFGSLVRIGMCPITATTADAQAALARFFAAQGKEVPAAEADQITALEAHIAALPTQGAAPPARVATATLLPLQQAAGLSTGGDDRAADITAAVRLATGIPAARQVELIGELLGARDASGQPITVQESVRRIQTVAAQLAAGNTPGATTITAGRAERDKFVAQARDAMLSRMFNGNIPKTIWDRTAQAPVDFKPQRASRRLGSLIGLAEETLIQSGFDGNQVRDLEKSQIARLVMGSSPHDFGLRASSDGAAYNVSGMYANILLDAAHVMLRRSYDDARTTFQVWMKQGQPIEDFKLQYDAIAGELGDPRAVPEDGAFEETTMSDAKESFQLTVWGEIFSLTWQAVVGDKLGAFGEVPGKLGAAMRRKENRLAYGVLKDNAAMADTGLLFNATAQTTAGGHNNLSTGAGTPTVANLNTLTKRMMEMRGLNTSEGGALNLMPRWILGPPALRGTILELLGSFANPAAGGSAAGSSGVKNIWENALEPVIEGELGAAATGGSDTAWYLGTDANEMDTITYRKLAGLETPVIETEAAFTHLALRWRIYSAFAVYAADYRGLQKHAGA